MIDSVDKVFVHPRHVLAAKKVDIYDAVNLVIYAKIPLITAHHGKDLVAGFINIDETGTIRSVLQKSSAQGILEKYRREIDSVRYPVAPSQYEPILEKMVAAKELTLPYFFHEHDFISDRRRRADLFLRVNSELRQLVEKGEIILQLTDSERTNVATGQAWMTAETLRAYLSKSGVGPWWGDEENIKAHPKLERVLMSDALASGQMLAFQYDVEQLPSRLFASMLLRRGFNPYGNRRSSQNSVSDLVKEAAEINQSAKIGSRFVSNQVAQSENPSHVESDDYERLREPPQLHKPQEPQESEGLSGQGEWSDLSEPSRGVEVVGIVRRYIQGAFTSELPPEGSIVTPALPRLESADVHKGQSQSLQQELQSQEEAAARDDAQDHGVMISKKEVAVLLSVSKGTVDNLRKRPDFPPHLELGPNTIRWLLADIVAWRDKKKKI